VEYCCLGPSQFLGRSIDVFWYWKLLDGMGVRSDDPIRSLLTALGRRGYVVGYRWTISTEGIHGWLGPEEASQLGQRLFALPLPVYEHSFATMAAFKKAGNDTSFQALSLSYVGTVCRMASKEGKGVLWGNDVFAEPL